MGDIGSILTEWGFPELVETFLVCNARNETVVLLKAQEIDVTALIELDVNTVKELIPKIGPRVKFLKKLQIYQALDKMDVVITNRFQDDSPNSTISNINSLDNIDDTYSFKSSSPVESDTCQDEIKSNSEAGEAFKIATRKPHAFAGLAMFETACRKSYSLNLTEFLNLTNAGKYILAAYKKKNILSTKSRNILVDLLINGIMSECSGNLTSNDFENLSKKICELFTTENACTYYIPRVSLRESVKNKPVNAKGKLVDKYRNLKRLYNTNILKGEESTKTSEIAATSHDVENSAVWLKNWTEPWDTVMTHWENTFQLRRNNQVSTVQQFIQEWPILKHKSTCVLIEYDFNEMYPSSTMYIYTKWNSFFNKLHSLKSALDKAAEELLSSVSSDLSEDSKNAIEITALAALFPPKGRIRQKNVHWKPTIIECQESIINHVKIPGEIERFIANKKAQAQTQNKHIQPYIIVVGQSLVDITEAYLIIDHLIYKANSVLHCFDLLFKSYHVLCAEYPPESEHIWLLIQHSIYKVSTSWDKKIPYVFQLVNDLQE